MAGPLRNSTSVVLIVEDDPLLRMLAVEVVEEAGFIALQTAETDEAVAQLESRLDISLLFTDVNAPGSMEGLKLAHAVRERRIAAFSGAISGSSMIEQLRSIVGSG